jgi:Na+-transporting methylmalonyl-CoA/oxaloacetate decarboxylase gamma subunit
MTTLIDNLHHLTGFLIVLLILTALWAVTAIIGSIFRAQAARKPQVHGLDVFAEPKKLADEEVIAVTAAVVALLGENSRIVSIKSGSVEWSREGLRDHFASHRVR